MKSSAIFLFLNIVRNYVFRLGTLILIYNALQKLMGLEEYGNEDEDEDEECLKRRITAEAHLDYIYTQHRKP